MSTAFLLKIEQSKAYIYQGNLKKARHVLIDLNTETRVENRWRDHYLGIIKMREGFFDEAITLFLNTVAKNGNNLSVILDLAACYLNTGQIYNWLKMVDLAEYEYKQNSEKLDLPKKIQCLMLLAKFMEEKGYICESLEIYNQLLALVHECDVNSKLNPEYIKIAAQIIRIHGQYHIKGEVDSHYQLLSVHHSQNSNLDCDFEIQHALMIYELSFYGPESCLIRYRRICKNPLAESFEMNWIHADLFYGFHCNGYTEQALEFSSQLNVKSNTFTSAITEIIKNNKIEQEKYTDIVTLITPAAQLRLLKIWIMKSNDLFALRKQSLSINSFTKSNKQIWNNFFNYNNQNKSNSTDRILVISKSFNELILNNQKIKLTNSYLEIFLLLVEKTDLSLTDVLLRLWNSTGTESDISRLRMRISRLNKILLSEFGLINVFLLDKNSLKTKYKIIIK